MLKLFSIQISKINAYNNLSTTFEFFGKTLVFQFKTNIPFILQNFWYLKTLPALKPLNETEYQGINIFPSEKAYYYDNIYIVLDQLILLFKYTDVIQ